MDPYQVLVGYTVSAVVFLIGIYAYTLYKGMEFGVDDLDLTLAMVMAALLWPVVLAVFAWILLMTLIAIPHRIRRRAMESRKKEMP